MGASCAITPKIQYKGQEVDSQLFPELVAFTGNRETAKDIFSMTRSKEFINSLEGIEKNSVGEPTLESLDKALNIRSVLENGISVEAAKKELHVETSTGTPVLYNSMEEVYNKVTSFNNENPKLVADIEQVDGKFKITVEGKTPNNIDKPSNLVFNNSLNNKLLSILKTAGFDVELVEQARFNAIFSPQRATTNAEGLLTVIQILKGEKSEELFPEEFSHVMIEGLMNNPLVNRLVNSLSSLDILKTVFGEEFQKYVSLYKGDMMMLQKEAAAKLLSESLKKQPLSIDRQSLLDRVVNFIKTIFNKITGNMVEDAIDQASRDADMIASNILNDDLASSIDKDAIINANTMYSAERELKGMEAIAEKALEMASKRYSILQSRKRGRYNKEEYKKIKNLQKTIEEKQYALSVQSFIEDCLEEIEILNKRIYNLANKSTENNLDKIKEVSSTLRSIKEFTDAYQPIISKLKILNSLKRRGEIEISDEDLHKIVAIASKVDIMITDINDNYKNLRYDTIYNFLKIYWGEDKLITAGKDKGKTITLEQIMKTADKDINFIDTLVTAMSDASDSMLTLVDKVVKNTQNKRDAKLEEILANVRAAHAKLEKAGYKTDFMFERDENGNLNGHIISDIDFAKFRKARKEYIVTLKEKKLKYFQIKNKLDIWYAQNTEGIIVNASGKVETLPKMSIYGKPENQKLKNVLSKEQKEYYDYMIELKSILDSMLPERYTNLYRAIMVRDDTLEAITKSIKDPKKAGKILKENLKDRFFRREDDLGFGDTSEGKKIELDFRGNPIDKLPVYYTRPLEDMSRLSTDFTSSILSYASTAINYEEMSKVIDALELTREYMKDEEGRKVAQKFGDKKIVQSTLSILGKTFNKNYTKIGERTNIGKRIDAYFKSTIYEERKEDEGTINFFGKQLDIATTLDTIKNYSGAVGLGLNLFSGISNVTMGKTQSFIEAIGGEYFNLKDSAKSIKQYWELLPSYMSELNSSVKKSKMSLLIDKFDALEEFYSSLRQRGYYNGALSRVIGSSNIYFLNNMGEHYLHTRNMLSMLNATKVKKDGKEISLYDAFKVEEKEGVYQLVLSEGITDLKGNLISTTGLDENSKEYAEVEERFTDYVSNQKNRIGKVNQALNGAFNENDKGEIQRHALGRLVMQFRQWMPAHYGRRFAAAHYDARLDQTREGYYRTFFRFSFDTLKDATRMKFEIGTRWKELSPHEQANLKKSLGELTIFALLGLLISCIGPEKDKKGKWGQRMAIYQLKRLKLETGASIPWISMFENFTQIAQKPAAAITTVNNFADVLKVWNMNKEIQQGRYKGYSQWEKDFAEALPIYGQIKKGIDIKDEDSMFQIFNY